MTWYGLLLICLLIIIGSEYQVLAEIPKTKEQLDPDFYQSREWRALRQRVFAVWGYECMKCGITHKGMHVDHILPRSKYPELELEFNNMQILCQSHNIEKSNTDYTDYRDIERILGASSK